MEVPCLVSDVGFCIVFAPDDPVWTPDATVCHHVTIRANKARGRRVCLPGSRHTSVEHIHMCSRHTESPQTTLTLHYRGSSSIETKHLGTKTKKRISADPACCLPSLLNSTRNTFPYQQLPHTSEVNRGVQVRVQKNMISKVSVSKSGNFFIKLL